MASWSSISWFGPIALCKLSKKAQKLIKPVLVNTKTECLEEVAMQWHLIAGLSLTLIVVGSDMEVTEWSDVCCGRS